MNLKLPKKRAVDVPASSIKKVISYLFDFIILGFLMSPIQNITSKLIPSDIGVIEVYSYVQSNPEIANLIMINSVFSGLMIVGYFTFFDYFISQTPGKMLLKLRTVPEKKSNPGFWNYLLSNLTFIPTFPFVILWIIDPIHMIISKSNQRFMEKIAKLLVVESYEGY